jgi:hypothetical protein
LADALEGHDSLGRAAVEQTVFGRFCGQLADRRQPEIDGKPTPGRQLPEGSGIAERRLG